jgi:lipopolysaccharide export system protein LptA
MILLLIFFLYGIFSYCFSEEEASSSQLPVTDIHAESLECDTAKGTCVATGMPHPYVIRRDANGKKTIEAEILTLTYETQKNPSQKEGKGEKKPSQKEHKGKKNASQGSQIQYIDALRDVKITLHKNPPQKDVVITGQQGRLEYQKQMLYLMGKVIINDGLNIIRGDNGEVNMKTGVYKISGKTRSHIVPRQSIIQKTTAKTTAKAPQKQ